MDQREWMDDLMERAKANLCKDGELLPLLHVRGESEVLIGLGGLPGAAQGRGRLMETLGRKAAYLRPTLVIAVMDAYISESAGSPRSGSLADDPGAGECVIVASLDIDGHSSALVCPYVRRPSLDGLEIEFGAVQEWDDGARLFLLEAFFRGAATGDCGRRG